MTTKTRHLVSLWNPSYSADVMDQTVALLRARAHEFRDRMRHEDDVYVWWGRIKSANRQQPLPHGAEVLALDTELSSQGGENREVHLYLTDYRSLYVGHVGEIVAGEKFDQQRERDHIPAFYAGQGLRCDFWFRLFDVRCVISDDTVGVVEELKKLRNVRYNDRPVSIYGGMVELPLIVTRDDGAEYFESDVREKLIDGRFWVEHDAERKGVGNIERDLRDNVVGETAWSGLDPTVRLFVATAESVFRAHRRDAVFDFSPVVVDFAKAIELQANLHLRQGLAGLPEADRRANIDGRTVDLARGELWPLGALSRVIPGSDHIRRALVLRLAHGQWFAGSLPKILESLSNARNPAAHSAAVSREDAQDIRNRVLGIGMPGILAELGRVRVVARA